MSVFVLEGLKPWVVQRVSAIYLAVFILYAVYALITTDRFSFESWQQWLNNPLNSVAIGLFIITLLLHAWVGMRDVVLDYFHTLKLRLFVLAVIIGVLVGCGLWSFRVLLLSVIMA